MKTLNIFILLLTFTFSGCNKDSYFKPYAKIDDFSIVPESIESRYIITQLDSINIYPVLQGLNTEKSYSYEWRLYTGSTFTVLSTEKNLKEVIVLGTGTYSLQYSVIDNDTKIKAISALFYVEVTGGFSQGWIIGNNVNGKGQLSFIRDLDDNISYNTLEELNNAVYPGKVIAAYSGAVGSFFSGQFKQILYFTDQGLTVFNSDNMMQTSELDYYFIDPLTYLNKPGYGISGTLYDQYLVNEGLLYAAEGQDFFGAEIVDYGKFTPAFEGDYSLFPFVFSSTGSPTYFYDNKNKKFLSVPYFGRSFSYPTTSMTNAQFSLNAVGRTMVAADQCKSNNYFALLKDNSNDYYIYYLPFSATSAVSGGKYYKLSSFAGLDKLAAFAASNVWDYAYFAAENKIYKIDGTNGTVTLFQEFPSDTQVADIKILKNGTESGKQITVALNKGETGEIQYIYMTTFGDRDTSRESKVFTGFGHIVNLSYRLPNAG
ncbi:hypothetical protein FAZ19_03945 [Sphingobacterium alkalisoli]|uniref:PKD-like family protein n=1 Tax=Sphingobacterium alkalisoli TaxID=1874115 RepID=A0A4U0H9E9_9SPHI|nr:PKD-like family lipoprotein [Sphingobacterium alkalisoli]TJY68416.1 hypothetical protein FAZ19_03945 [Sphingobacterium alkalisoli]GGH06647.1 hypothetical protein GCM10011418_03460 [Sphingobacterium alkalisoli]